MMTMTSQPKYTTEQIAEMRCAFDAARSSYEEIGSLAIALQILAPVIGLEMAIERLGGFERSSTPKMGDILVTSWGYDQTNVDFYQVVGITKASVKVVRMDTVIAERGESSDKVIPGVVRNAKPMTRRTRIEAFRHGYSCSIGESRGDARLWDGQPESQTASGCGH